MSKPFTKEHRKKLSRALKNHTRSEEHRKNLSESVKAFWDNPENKERMRQRQIGTKRPNSKRAKKRKSLALLKYWKERKEKRE